MQLIQISRPNTKKILLVNIYRPPEGNVAQAMAAISDTLDEIENINKSEIVVMGDFNVDYSKKRAAQIEHIKKFETGHQLQQMITEPTRYNNKSHSTIDLIFTNIKHCTRAGVMNYNISDHLLTYIIKKKPRNCKETKTYRGRSYTGCTEELIEQNIRECNLRPITEEKDPNKCWELLKTMITETADRLCPIRVRRIRVHTVKYLTHQLLELQKDRDYFVDKARKSKDPGDRFIAGCLIRKARNEIDKARANYYKHLAEQYNQNHKKYWADIEDIEPKLNGRINGIKDDLGKVIPDIDLPEAVNDFFVNIGAKLANKFRTINKEDKIFVPATNPVTFDIKPVSRYDILFQLTGISTTKASGMKDLSAGFMVSAIKTLVTEFTHLYNSILTQGVYPDDWKIATVTPIPKIPHPQKCGDLRPISILPLPGRILEKVISDNITQHLEKTNYLADQQCGFRRGRSTTKALSTLLDEILTAMDRGELAVTIFFDFKKAFDTVDHDILIWKLEKAGLGDRLCRLIKNYLTNRKQATRIDGVSSGTKPVNTGVPQGSTLGPLLFIIYANDFPEISTHALYTTFADDAAATVRNKVLQAAREILNKLLKNTNTWCDENKLTLNIGKTEYMIFGTKNRLASKSDIELKIGDQTLREVKSYRYLGTTLDQTLSVVDQLNKLNQLIAQKLTSFRKIRKCMSERTAITIYKATILPIFYYNDIIYQLLNRQQITKLQRIQNRALRMVFGGRVLSVAEMHNTAGVEYLENRREAHLLALMFNRSKDTKYTDSSERITRRADATLLKVPRSTNNKYTNSPVVKGSGLWNQLPVELRQCETKFAFKVLYRKHRSGLPLVSGDENN